MYQPGLPDDAPIPSSTTLDQAAELAVAWAIGEVTLDDIPFAAWSLQATIHFINNLPDDLDDKQLESLDNHLGLSDTRNAEIGRTWFIQVATRRYEPAYAKLEEHLNRYGRTRLVAVVYGSLATNGQDLALAKSMFAKARSAYHPLTVSSIEGVFRRAEAEPGE